MEFHIPIVISILEDSLMTGVQNRFEPKKEERLLVVLDVASRSLLWGFDSSWRKLLVVVMPSRYYYYWD